MDEMRRIDPYSDKEKELIYGVKIEHLTKEQIEDKYNISLVGDKPKDNNKPKTDTAS